MSEKLCPLCMGTCGGTDCAWWVSGYTTERIKIECCALEYIAMKNSEGYYRVYRAWSANETKEV